MRRRPHHLGRHLDLDIAGATAAGTTTNAIVEASRGSSRRRRASRSKKLVDVAVVERLDAQAYVPGSRPAIVKRAVVVQREAADQLAGRGLNAIDVRADHAARRSW